VRKAKKRFRGQKGLGRKKGSGNKYEPLRAFLAKQKQDEFVLSLKEIEDILGFELPRSAQRAEWWDDDTPEYPRLQRQAIRDGGFDSRRLPDGLAVRFRRT
jgi:hypothetical protein